MKLFMGMLCMLSPFNFAYNMHSKTDIMNKYAAIEEYY